MTPVRRAPPALPPALAGLLIGMTAARALWSVRRIPPAVPEIPAFLTLAAAARYTGLSEALLQRLGERRKLRMIPDTGETKYARADLDNLPRVAELAECASRLRSATNDLRRAVRRRRTALASIGADGTQKSPRADQTPVWREGPERTYAE